MVKIKKASVNAMKFGLAGGILSAICVILATIAGIFGMFPMYNSLIVDVYGVFGYSISGVGIVLGAVYGFVDGFVLVWIFALIYNKLL